jgi:hypothetical protein
MTVVNIDTLLKYSRRPQGFLRLSGALRNPAGHLE